MNEFRWHNRPTWPKLRSSTVLGTTGHLEKMQLQPCNFAGLQRGLYAAQNTLLFEIPTSESEVIEAQSRSSEAYILVKFPQLQAVEICSKGQDWHDLTAVLSFEYLLLVVLRYDTSCPRLLTDSLSVFCVCQLDNYSSIFHYANQRLIYANLCKLG